MFLQHSGNQDFLLRFWINKDDCARNLLADTIRNNPESPEHSSAATASAPCRTQVLEREIRLVRTGENLHDAATWEKSILQLNTGKREKNGSEKQISRYRSTQAAGTARASLLQCCSPDVGRSRRRS